MIFIFILSLIGILFFIPIRISWFYKDNVFRLSLKFGKFEFEFPKLKKRESSKPREKRNTKRDDDFYRFQKFFAFIQAFYDTSENIRKTVVVEKTKIKAEYGTEDAAFTGIAVGLAYAEIYKLIGFLASIFTVNQPEITITPIFEDKSVFTLDAEGIIKTKAAHIIFTAVRFYMSYKKALK